MGNSIPKYKIDSNALDTLHPAKQSGSSFHTDDEDSNWDMKSVDRSIDPQKATTFLQNIADPKKRSIAKKIIDNTRYISFQTMKNKYVDLIKQLPDQYNLAFLTSDKIGSEHWLIVLLWPYLKTKCVKIINSHLDIDNTHPIVIIDDCIYSGCHMCGVVDALQYDYKQTTGKVLINTFICLTAYRGIDSTGQLCNDFGTVEVLSAEVLSPLKLENINYMYKYFGCESEYVLPLYFDHKIANNFGSYPNIYSQIVNEQPSRYKIELLEEKLKKYAINTPKK